MKSGRLLQVSRPPGEEKRPWGGSPSERSALTQKLCSRGNSEHIYIPRQVGRRRYTQSAHYLPTPRGTSCFCRGSDGRKPLKMPSNTRPPPVIMKPSASWQARSDAPVACSCFNNGEGRTDIGAPRPPPPPPLATNKTARWSTTRPSSYPDPVLHL